MTRNDMDSPVKRLNDKGITRFNDRRSKSGVTRMVVVLSVCLLLLSQTSAAFAYFSLPGVSITPSQNAVSLQSGQSQTIGVSISPMQESQLPGCGMAECPQICGPECLNSSGWCVCAGTTYETYYTQVSVVSSDNSVVQAYFGSGALSITGVSAGSATITIYASLAKHVDSVAYVSVTVTEPPPTPPVVDPPGGTTSNPPGGTGGTTTNPPGGTGGNPSGGSTGGSTGNPSGGSTGGSTGGGQSSGTSGKTSVDASGTANEGSATQKTDAGTQQGPSQSGTQQAVVRMTNQAGVDYTVVTLGLGAKLSDVFAQAAGKPERVVIQQKDSAGNVVYSLSFFGADISADKASTFSGSLEGSLSTTLPEGVKAEGGALMLRFSDHPALPAKAEVYVSAGRHFSAATAGNIDVYQVDPQSREIKKVAQGGSVVDGYVIFDVDKAHDIILASGALTTSGAAAGGVAVGGAGTNGADIPGDGVPYQTVLIIVGAVVVAAIAVFFWVSLRRKRRVALETGVTNNDMVVDD